MMKRVSLQGLMNILVLVNCFYFIIPVSFVFAAGPAVEEGPMAWVWRIVNFAILVFLLVKFAGKPLRNFLKQRTEMIEKSIKDAQEAKEMSKKALEEVEQRLKLKDKEIADILEVAKASGEEEQKRLIEDAERLKTKILEQAKANIDHEVKMAKEAIKAEAVEEAIKLSEEKIKNRLTKEDHEKILQESIKLLGARN